MVPDNWSIQRLDDLALVERGKFSARPRNDPRFFGGDIPFVQTGDVATSGTYLKNFTQTLNSDGVKVSRVFPKETILITIAANIGETAITEFEIACPDSVVAIQPYAAKADVYWLKKLLETKQEVLDAQATQNAQKNINLQVLKPLSLLTPPLTEQKKIAQILFTWDQAITATERLFENSQQRKKGLMQQLLTGKKRLPGFEGEWEEAPLSELADYVKGYTYKSDEYSEIPTNTGFLTLKSLLRGGGYSKGGLKYLTTEIEDKFLVKEGDIVFAVTDITRGAEIVGAPLLVPNLRLPQVAISMDMVKLLVKLGVAPKFLYFALKRSTARNFMRSRASGSTVLHLDVKGSKKLRLPIPKDANEQEAISDVMTIADQEIEAIAQRLILLKEEKKALMQQLLTGKRRVNVETEAA